MPYQRVLNASAPILGSQMPLELGREFDLLRAELNDLRTKFASTLTKLDADAGVSDTNYAALGALAAAQFTQV
jgi:hypothetical protein